MCPTLLRRKHRLLDRESAPPPFNLEERSQSFCNPASSPFFTGSLLILRLQVAVGQLCEIIQLLCFAFPHEQD